MNETYEITYWLRIDTEPEKEEEKLLSLIKSFQGEIVEKSVPKKRQLSYQINKQNLGFMGIIYFTAEPEAISKIKTELKLYKNILRAMITKNKPVGQESRQEQYTEKLTSKETKSELESVESNFALPISTPN
ncbi:MAG: 30S ribosomal protein S6 [Patescibacteria group bacterium]